MKIFIEGHSLKIVAETTEDQTVLIRLKEDMADKQLAYAHITTEKASCIRIPLEDAE